MSDRVFVDTSVLVTILAEEAGWERFSDTLNSARERRTSPTALLEAVMALSSALDLQPTEIERTIRRFLDDVDVGIVAIDGSTATRAVLAFQTYGKGRHPARLNFGDCLSYACAKEHRLTLLYKGQDFAQTDLA